MIVSSNSTVACSPFTELRKEFEWCGHNLFPLGNNIRKESSGSGLESMISLQESTVLLMCCEVLKK
jgi:hypothetical protein